MDDLPVRDGNVIHIRFSRDLGSSLLNELRYRMELARWRERVRNAKPDPDDSNTWDWEVLDQLERQYDMVGLP